jgi:ribonuclease BN (tRNA processing enzyme)
MKKLSLAVICSLALLCGFEQFVYTQARKETPLPTQVVLLGTGTPLPDPARMGPSTAIVVDDRAYIFDAGTGMVRRAAAARDKGISALEPVKLRIAFLTHLHSDHTLGLADLILTPWVMGRTEPLDLWGPRGTRAMVDHILAAYREDIAIRTIGLEGSNTTGYKVNVHEIEPGDVYKDGNVTVKPFLVKHGDWKQAFGYRVETPDRVIVISGDTAPAESILESCHGCDILIAESYTTASFDLTSKHWQKYRRVYHTSTRELADIATRAKPGLLILIHRGNAGCDQSHAAGCREAGSEEQMLKEMAQYYSGKKLVAGHDLDVF